jgi:hypothetical protein
MIFCNLTLAVARLDAVEFDVQDSSPELAAQRGPSCASYLNGGLLMDV